MLPKSHLFLKETVRGGYETTLCRARSWSAHGNWFAAPRRRETQPALAPKQRFHESSVLSAWQPAKKAKSISREATSDPCREARDDHLPSFAHPCLTAPLPLRQLAACNNLAVVCPSFFPIYPSPSCPSFYTPDDLAIVRHRFRPRFPHCRQPLRRPLATGRRAGKICTQPFIQSHEALPQTLPQSQRFGTQPCLPSRHKPLRAFIGDLSQSLKVRNRSLVVPA